MSDQPISTRPLIEGEELLREKFYESIAAQGELMDKLSERLLTIELAIPGLYATGLKLLGREKATVIANVGLYITFACWLSSFHLPRAGEGCAAGAEAAGDYRLGSWHRSRYANY